MLSCRSCALLTKIDWIDRLKTLLSYLQCAFAYWLQHHGSVERERKKRSARVTLNWSASFCWAGNGGRALGSAPQVQPGSDEWVFKYLVGNILDVLLSVTQGKLGFFSYKQLCSIRKFPENMLCRSWLVSVVVVGVKVLCRVYLTKDQKYCEVSCL